MTLSETIEAWLLKHGYEKHKGERGAPETWTRPEWKGWWVDPRRGTISDRHEQMDLLVRGILYEESKL